MSEVLGSLGCQGSKTMGRARTPLQPERKEDADQKLQV